MHQVDNEDENTCVTQCPTKTFGIFEKCFDKKIERGKTLTYALVLKINVKKYISLLHRGLFFASSTCEKFGRVIIESNTTL